MFPHFSLGELVILLVVVLLIFGPKRLPELAGSIGQSIKLFKASLREGADESPKPQASKEITDKTS